jgi:hypothetical protein
MKMTIENITRYTFKGEFNKAKTSAQIQYEKLVDELGKVTVKNPRCLGLSGNDSVFIIEVVNKIIS